jgi:hypothetical protein
LCIPAYGQFLEANGEQPVTSKRAAMDDVLREADVVSFLYYPLQFAYKKSEVIEL